MRILNFRDTLGAATCSAPDQEAVKTALKSHETHVNDEVDRYAQEFKQANEAGKSPPDFEPVNAMLKELAAQKAGVQQYLQTCGGGERLEPHGD